MQSAELKKLVWLSALAKKYPAVKPQDWVLLAHVASTGAIGLPMAYTRANTHVFGSVTRQLPGFERLLKLGFIKRNEVPFEATNYRGKEGRGPRMEIVYTVVEPEPEIYL